MNIRQHDPNKSRHCPHREPLSASALCGALSATGNYAEAFAIALAQEGLDGTQLYEVQKHYASVQNTTSCNDPIEVDQTWLEELAEERSTLGSCQANAWLHALGNELPEEIIVLPEGQPKGRKTTVAKEWPVETALEAFPNPTAGDLTVVYATPPSAGTIELLATDLGGRIAMRAMASTGPAVATFDTSALAAGTYLLELRVDGIALQTARFVVVR